MDLGGTLIYLADFPIKDLEEYRKTLDMFQGSLISASDEQLNIVLKKLKFIYPESTMGQLFLAKYRNYINRRLSGITDELCPVFRESIINSFHKIEFSSLAVENLRNLCEVLVDNRKILLIKLSLLMRKAFNLKFNKKLLKFVSSRIRIYKFYFTVFKENRDKILRSKSFLDGFLVNSLKKHAKIYRRNNKIQNIFDVFHYRIKAAFLGLKIKLPTSAPITPRKSPKKPDYTIQIISNWADELVHLDIRQKVNIIKSIFPPIEKKNKLSKFYQRFIDYYNKFMYIKFFNKVEKNIQGHKIFHFLYMAQTIQHGKNFNKSIKLRKILLRLKNKRIKIIYLRLNKVNKRFQVLKLNSQKATKIIDRVKIRKYAKKWFRLGKIFACFRKMEVFGFKEMKKTINRLKLVLSMIGESVELLDRVSIHKVKSSLKQLIQYSRKYNLVKKLKLFFIRFYDLSLRKNFIQAGKDLKEIKIKIDTRNSFHHLKLYYNNSINLDKLEQQLQEKNLERDKRKSADIFIMNIEKVTKKTCFNLFKKCEKFYRFEFSEKKTLSDFKVLPNLKVLKLTNKNKDNCKSPLDQFMQLYAMVNSSLSTQRQIYEKIDKNCQDLSECLSLTSESISSTDSSILEISSKLSKINENKSKVIESNSELQYLLKSSEDLEQSYSDLSVKITQNIELDNSLELELSENKKKAAELVNWCNEAELEITRVEFDHSSIVRERESFRTSPERHTRLGLSPSPGRRSPSRQVLTSPGKDSFRSPAKSFMVRSPTSPGRSRGGVRDYR